MQISKEACIRRRAQLKHGMGSGLLLYLGNGEAAMKGISLLPRYAHEDRSFSQKTLNKLNFPLRLRYIFNNVVNLQYIMLASERVNTKDVKVFYC